MPRPRAEALEARELLTGYSREKAIVDFVPAVGAPVHKLMLDDRLADDTNGDGILNKQERDRAAASADHPGMFDIKGTIIGPGGTYHGGIIVDVVDASGAVISVDASGKPITDPKQFKVVVSGSNGNFDIFVPTSRLAEGDNQLHLRLLGPRNANLDRYNFTITVNTASVTADIAPVAPDPRNRPVSDPVRVTFSGPIDPSTFTAADLALTRDGGADLLAGATGVTITPVAGSASAFDVGLPVDLTSTPGQYALSVAASGVAGPAGNPGVGVATDAFAVVAVRPPRATSVALVGPAIRNRPLSEPVLVAFEQPIDPATFDANDLILSRDGGPNLIPGVAGIAARALSGTTFQVEGLGELTSAEGRYTLSVDAAGIRNTFGDPGTQRTSASFTVDLTPPSLAGVPRDLVVTVQPGASGAVVVFPGPSASDAVTALPTVTSAAPGVIPSNGATASGATFPIGTTTVRFVVADEAGNVSTATFAVTVVPQSVDLIGPTVVSTRAEAGRRGVRRLVVAFGEDMARGPAEHARNYVIRLAGRDGRLGTRDDARIRPASASYDAATRTVTLGLARRFPARKAIRLTIAGTTPVAPVDRAGNALDGDGDGRPGGDFATTLAPGHRGPRSRR